jgi:CheY-like chemotaxis protein
MAKFIEALKSKFAKQTETPAPVAAEPVSILVIDDDEEFLRTMRSLLEREGFNVLVANTGPKGLELMRYAPGDLRFVLLDYSMPRFDGLQTLKYVQEARPGVKVIAITGVPLSEVPAAFRAGVDKLFTKPFHPLDLFAAIKEMRAQHPAAARETR